MNSIDPDVRLSRSCEPSVTTMSQCPTAAANDRLLRRVGADAKVHTCLQLKGSKGDSMNARLAIAGLVTCAFLAPAIGHAADDQDKDREHPKAFVKDSAITTAVKTKLAAQHLGSVAKIHVDTDANGMVTLRGTARSQEDIDKAVAVASKTKSVRSVNN